MDEPKGAGRPSKFNDAVKEKILQLAEAGKTNEEIADIIGISSKTLGVWQGKYQELGWAIRESKQIADDLVEAALFSRAVGYSHKSEKIFCDKFGEIHRAKTIEHYPPDVGAATMWLKNRQPENWSAKTGEEQTLNISVSLSEKLQIARARAGKK